MTRVGSNFFATILAALLAAVSSACADSTNEAPDFKEVYGLIQSHLGGVTDADLNRAAVEGLLAQFPGKASIASREDSAANAPLVSRADVVDDGVAYLRVNSVASGLAGELRSAWQRLEATNKLSGLVLDLRFAGGSDFAAAASAADLFVSKEQLLLDWGFAAARSQAKSDAIALPVAVLANGQTSGAAEALAAVLRETGAGLIIGRTTSGSAMVMREFPLKNGQTLRIAASPVKLGDGTALSAQGIKPDIEVVVNPSDERAYLEDPRATIGGTIAISRSSVATDGGETNRPARRNRLSEADLVREHRRDTNQPQFQPSAARTTELERPIILDPALSRAVDLVKGLAVVRGSRR